MIENKKSSILLVLKILEEYSDENHFLTQQNIIDKIYEIYGIDLERKSIANSIMLLEELDYDIKKGPKGGFALLSRTFEKSEVTFIIDAILSSRSIPSNQAKDLIKKVSSTLSKHDRKSYDYIDKNSEICRTSNREVFYNIDVINEAISENKWICFKYLDYDENAKQVFKRNGYVYKCSPCYLVNNFGRYYLLGYVKKYNSINIYRVDYMKDISFIEEKRVNPNTLDEFKKYNSIYSYINEHIYMCGGKSIEVTFILKDTSVIQYVIDWFGNNAKIYKDKKVLNAKVKCNELAFSYWAMQYGEYIKVISPLSMVEKIKNKASNILKMYR